MTLAEKLDYIRGEPLPTNPADFMGVFDIKPILRLGVPKIIGNDGTIGITAQGLPADTRYPAGPVLASTWNAVRAMEEGVAQGREARARGIHENLGPGVDFYRTSFGGRSAEYMTGEIRSWVPFSSQPRSTACNRSRSWPRQCTTPATIKRLTGPY